MPSTLNLAALGRRVKETRLARRLTLEEVVSKTDFTVSWLSKLENGQLSPSLEGLVGLADALGSGVQTLVEGLTVPPRHVVVRAENGRKNGTRNHQSSPNGRGQTRNGAAKHLADGWQGASMQPVVLQLESGEQQRTESRDGERFLLVLQGRARVVYGDDVILLDRGDSIYFDASFPHTISAAGRTAARVLSVMPTPG